MEALGLGYDRLKSDHPGLIYCSCRDSDRPGPMPIGEDSI